MLPKTRRVEFESRQNGGIVKNHVEQSGVCCSGTSLLTLMNIFAHGILILDQICDFVAQL